MPAIDVDNLTSQMIGAASGVLRANWSLAKSYAEVEFGKLADTLEYIQREVAAGRMTPSRARRHLEMQRNAAATVMLTVKGLSVLSVESAINVALSVVRQTVNTAVGFTLL